MERSREGRRSNIAQSNGLPKRRQRSNNLRRSPEYGEMDMHETARLRERISKRDLSNRSKRRRQNKVDGEETTEESSGEEENETENHLSSREITTTNEIISFPVPRKARSVSVKRSHENCVAGGFVDEQNHLRDSVSPSSSNCSITKKMKTNRPETWLPKPAAKPSISVEEDIEFEIAEVLYGLMKQSQSSKKEDSAENPLPDPLICVASKKKVEVVDSLIIENGQQAEMNVCSPKKCQISGLNAVISDNGVAKTASAVMEKQGDLKPSVEEESDSVYRAVTKEKSVRTENESPDSDVDFRNPTSIKPIYTMTKVESQLEVKFKIDFMAPPMASSSPMKVDISLDRNYKKMETLSKDEAKVVKKEMRAEDSKGKKMDTINEKRDSLNLNLGKPDQAGSDCCLFEQSQKQHLSKVDISKVHQTAQSSSVPMPNGPPPPGYMPPFQTSAPIDASARSSTALQPRPKRCVMHHCIAQNIQLHQQYSKVSHFWPPTIGPASLSGAKPSNFNVVPSTETLILGNPLLNLSPTEEKSKVAATLTGLTGKDKNDAAKRKQVAAQQASQPVSASTLKHGNAFTFPMNPYQITVNQSVSSKSATSISKASSTPGISTSSTVLPGAAAAAAVSFNYPNLAANQAPYLTILQNNGYPFSISAPVGNPSAVSGGTHGQGLPFFNGSFHSSQMFHPQLQQQQARSQPLAQPGYQNAVPSSHKQPENQKPRGGQVCGDNILSSTSMHSQQLQEHNTTSSNQSRKMEHETSGEHTNANTQRKAHCQNPPFPQSLNFALVPSASVGKGGLDLVPSQAFSMSFVSLAGNNKASNLKFSSMAQNPTIFHSLPEMARQGYQVSAVQSAQQKNHQISDGKSGSGSTNMDDGKNASSGKSHSTIGQTYVFDNSARSLNFVSSPVTGNWPTRSITPSTASTKPPVVANSSSSHQQLVQLQKQHMAQQHHQQPTTASRSKTQTTNPMPTSSIAANFSSNAANFSQTVPQSNPAAQSAMWKNSARIPVSPATNVKNYPQHLLRPSQGQTQISFGVNTKSGL